MGKKNILIKISLKNKKMAKKKDYTYAVGRRRSASARIRLFKGRGKHEVNGKPIGEYFPGVIMRSKWEKPFELTDTTGKYFVTVRVVGGGKEGQLDAVVHGIAKSLNELNREKYRISLKRAGLLTRDARIRERRKIGTGGKARRKKQSPKR